MNLETLTSIINIGKNKEINQSKNTMKINIAKMEDFMKNFSLNIDNMIEKIKKIDSIINSIGNSWKGIDSEEYLKSLLEYKNKLIKSLSVLVTWENYFKNRLQSFTNVKEQSLSNVRNIENIFMNFETLSKEGDALL